MAERVKNQIWVQLGDLISRLVFWSSRLRRLFLNAEFNADFKYIKNFKIRYMLKKLYYFELDNSLNVKN
jgi:hypothetical protein